MVDVAGQHNPGEGSAAVSATTVGMRAFLNVVVMRAASAVSMLWLRALFAQDHPGFGAMPEGDSGRPGW